VRLLKVSLVACEELMSVFERFMYLHGQHVGLREPHNDVHAAKPYSISVH
jgi:hypothetical protein